MINKSRIHGLCDSCIEKIDWTADSFFLSVDGFCFDEIMSCCVYGFYPRQIIFGLKLGGKTYIAKGIGKLMGERAALSKTHFDYIVPVPSSKKRIRQRGFNQAALLGQYTANELSIPMQENVLLKSSETKSMRGSSGLDRRQMLKEAFTVTDNSKVKDKTILLLDDVITTGSTADECSKTLKNAGAAYVGVICFASASGYGII